MADLLDRCSSPPLITDSFDNDVRLCLTDLCQRISVTIDESSTSAIYNQIPSPVFKRKIEEQSISNKRSIKAPNLIEEQTPKKKRNRPSTKKSSTDIPNTTIPTEKIEEPIEQDPPAIKPTIPISNVMTSSSTTNTFDYVCEWDNCRK
jgi:hypothetical protein